MSIFGNKSIVVRWVFAEDLNSELSLIKAAILSLSLSDAQGNLLDFDSPFSYIWEFNFRDFDINQDYYASDTVELLKRQVVDFEKNKEKGIDSKDFAKKLWDYGLVFNCYDLKSITWITFHQIYAKDSYSKLIAFASSLIHGSISLFLQLQHFQPQAHLQVLGAVRRIMKKFHANPSVQIESKDLPDIEVGDLDARQTSLKGSSPNIQLAARNCFILEDPPDDNRRNKLVLREFGSVVNDAGHQDARMSKIQKTKASRRTSPPQFWIRQLHPATMLTKMLKLLFLKER
ncbi:hypothetical protein GOBAR_DD19452 [Gossypium barbadense]|nr:hypothetical protein GOBAR_DD19452 [Gossypium barbadense]